MAWTENLLDLFDHPCLISKCSATAFITSRSMCAVLFSYSFHRTFVRFLKKNIKWVGYFYEWLALLLLLCLWGQLGKNTASTQISGVRTKFICTCKCFKFWFAHPLYMLMMMPPSITGSRVPREWMLHAQLSAHIGKAFEPSLSALVCWQLSAQKDSGSQCMHSCSSLENRSTRGRV